MLTQKYRKLIEDSFDATALGLDNFNLEWKSATSGDILAVTWRGDASYAWTLTVSGNGFWRSSSTPGEVFANKPEQSGLQPLQQVLATSVPRWVGRILSDMQTGKAYVSAIESLRKDIFDSLEPSGESTFFSPDELARISGRLDELVASLAEAAKDNEELAKKVANLEGELNSVRTLFESMPKNTALRAVFSKLGRGLSKLWESKEIRELAVEKLKELAGPGVGS